MNRLLLALGLALLLVPPVSGTEQTAIDTARLTRVEDFSETLANRFHRLSADLIRGEGQAWSAWLAPDFAAGYAAVSGGFWQRAYFNNFSTTIGGGTTQVQANIVAEHVLGLPK